jgi:hypothetical protein
MTKPTKPRAEIESMIRDEVRRHRHCEDFRWISIYRIVDKSALFNWAPSTCNYGEAGTDSCDAALREIIPRLQQQYDLAED